MERTPRTILLSALGIVFFIGIIIFGYNRFGRYIDGPEITSINLDQHQTISELYYHIQGSVENTTQIRINNNDITLNQDKTFKHISAISPGTTDIDIEIQDPFGKKRNYTYTISSTYSQKEYISTLNEARAKQETESLETNTE